MAGGGVAAGVSGRDSGRDSGRPGGGRPAAVRARPKPPAFSGRSERFGTVPFALKPHVSPHGQVTAVSMMKDEGPYVIEWVAHQIAIGFTDIVVYTNDCSDGTDRMLMRLEELGLVHHRVNTIPEGLRPQPSALNHAQAEPVVRASDWLMVFDADEFLSIRYGDGTLDDLIGAAKARGANGIVVTWRVFGSGGVTDWSRAPVTEQYLMAAPASWNKGWGVKTLFTFDAEYWNLGIHRPKLKNRHIDTGFPDSVKWLNGSGRPMEDYFTFRGWRSIARTVGYDWVQLNHYAVKSVDAYAIRKLRGNVNFKKDKYNSDYWALMDRNEVRDETQLRYRERRGAVIAALLSDPVLAGLHAEALAQAEARLEALRATEDYARLRAELAAASAVPIGQIAAKPPQPRDKQKIAALMSEVERRRTSAARAARRADPAPAAASAGRPDALPDGLILETPADAAAETDVPWVRSHAVELPADPRVLTTIGLRAVEEGKFERGLARKLPTILARGARVLAVGAGVGFLPAHLAQVRPDLTILAQEDDPALAATLRRVWARNGLAAAPQLALSPVVLPAGPALGRALAELVAEAAAGALILGDPRLSPDVLAEALGPDAPAQIVLCGRLFERHFGRLAEIEAFLAGLGYAAPYGLDPRQGRGFLRAAAGGQAAA